MRSAKLERTFIILTIIFINICLLVPVWQSATNTQLRWQLAHSEELLKENEEQKMLISASIARKTTPEFIIEQSEEYNIVFTQIGSESGSLMASNR
ncbi:MAG: hypothetical protein J5775_07370 [Spirochaetales bacterium]|nr:hypothetical protein [Spirochaetales bacterium]